MGEYHFIISNINIQIIPTPFKKASSGLNISDNWYPSHHNTSRTHFIKKMVQTFRYFGHGMTKPYTTLSNFNECIIRGYLFVETEGKFEEREYIFPCSEHYWWAHFMRRHEDISRLAVGGDLSTIDGLKLILGDFIGETKGRYWGRKGSIGIVAKILTQKNEKGERYRAKEIGMCVNDYPLEQYGPSGGNSTLVSIWKKILFAKYTQNSIHRAVLMSTGSEILVDFTRGTPEKKFWTAHVVNGGKRYSAGRIVGGELVGNNFMGKCMMAVRKEMYGNSY